MNKSVYQRPELTEYGSVREITQATGTGAFDSIVVGVTITTPIGTTGTSVTISSSPGSGTTFFNADIDANPFN